MLKNMAIYFYFDLLIRTFEILNYIRGSLHAIESGLSFNPERHLKFSSCLHETLSRGLKDLTESKSHSGLKLVADSCTDHLMISPILTHLRT